MTPVRGRGGLVERALDHLRAGPAGSLELARDVLFLCGPPDYLSKAVLALLNADPRFQVDARDVWSLSARRAEPPLAELSFAVVDVEATGGASSSGHRIIEIAVLAVQGGEVGEVWHTLVNPGRRVPSGVRILTGITDELLVHAPYFDHIALEVAGRLEGRIFVGHNAGFDWRLVSEELQQALGLQAPARRLCTVQMARRLLPGLRRRNLDALSGHFGIPIGDRHRAGGDALATARILLRLLEEAESRGLVDLTALDAFLGQPPRRGRHRRAASSGSQTAQPGAAAGHGRPEDEGSPPSGAPLRLGSP